MRLLFLAVLFSTMPLYRACDLRDLMGASPERVRHKTEVALKPYFPSSVVSIDAKGQALLAITCTDLGNPPSIC